MEKKPIKLMDEEDTRIYNKDELRTSLTEEIRPRDVTADILGFDVIPELRECRNNSNPVEVNVEKIIEEKFITKKKEPKKLKKSWEGFSPVRNQRSVRNFEYNRETF